MSGGCAAMISRARSPDSACWTVKPTCPFTSGKQTVKPRRVAQNPQTHAHFVVGNQNPKVFHGLPVGVKSVTETSKRRAGTRHSLVVSLVQTPTESSLAEAKNPTLYRRLHRRSP